MNEEVDYAQLVYDEMPTHGKSFGWFKGTLEDLIGRTLSPSEAQELYDLVSRRTG